MKDVPKYFIENKIPKVRWMQIGRIYKARYINVKRHTDSARMFVYVLNNEHAIAYRDEQLTQELGLVKIEHLVSFGELKNNMESGRAYRARIKGIHLHLKEAHVFIYVLNDKYVIAYRDEALTDELGMLKRSSVSVYGELNIKGSPQYKSVCPISITYGKLVGDGSVFKASQNYSEQIERKIAAVMSGDVEVSEEKTTEPVHDKPIPVKVASKKDETVVRVTISAPEPACQYEQLTLF